MMGLSRLAGYTRYTLTMVQGVFSLMAGLLALRVLNAPLQATMQKSSDLQGTKVTIDKVGGVVDDVTDLEGDVD
jgi:hypothetical protein